jgi:hypothetical protein
LDTIGKYQARRLEDKLDIKDEELLMVLEKPAHKNKLVLEVKKSLSNNIIVRDKFTTFYFYE